LNNPQEDANNPLQDQALETLEKTKQEEDPLSNPQDNAYM
jgi:hypothetical protein